LLAALHILHGVQPLRFGHLVGPLLVDLGFGLERAKSRPNLPVWFWPLWSCGRTILFVDAARRFGENVRGVRLARGWTQEDLAHATGLASVQVSRIERGVREIRLGTLVRLVASLESTPNELLDGLYKPRKP